MVWREGNLPVAVIPDGEGMLLRFSANRFVMNRSYQGLAKPGDSVAAWGDMVMRNLKWRRSSGRSICPGEALLCYRKLILRRGAI